MTKFAKNGQLLPAVRKPIYEKVVTEQLGAFTVMPNGELVMYLGDIEGKPVNAIVSLSISTRNEFEKKARTKATAEPEVINVDTLFD